MLYVWGRGGEMRCRRVDVDILEVWRSGTLEARCRRVDVEM